MFFTKAFKGNNAWYMYLVVLLLVFITTQLGGIPFILYKVLSNPETMQQAMSGAEPDTAALTAVTGNAELALMIWHSPQDSVPCSSSPACFRKNRLPT